MRRRQPADEGVLTRLRQRYQGAAPPGRGQAWSGAYRLRMLFLDRWNLWRRSTLYGWRGPGAEELDGTNNATERAIGWWVKERYRTMRGYKREASAGGVSRLLAWCGNHLQHGGADLRQVLA
jgi:hypothetical protein